MTNAGTLNIPDEPMGVTYSRTMELRWLALPHTNTIGSRLQQAWRGDDGSVIWEDIPTVVEGESP